MLLGAKAMDTLKNAKVAVFGIGGVGSYTVEALARSGVGALSLFDSDEVCLTNINRQLIATHKTIGQKKVDVMKNRILDINPNCHVTTHACFYTAENASEYDLSGYTYIVDAIDTVSSKLILIEKAKAAVIPIISCMGAGNKLDPTKFEVNDIFKTSVCPLAKVMRRELKARGISSLKVVYSKEEALKPQQDDEIKQEVSNTSSSRRQTPGSISFVPSVAGLIIAAEVIKDIIGFNA